jgi:hypothetical protein
MACIQALSGFLGIKKAEQMVEVARRDARRVTDVGFVADMQGMRFASRPLFLSYFAAHRLRIHAHGLYDVEVA